MVERPAASWPRLSARLAAFGVDSLILTLVGELVGTLAFDELSAWGDRARVIGLLATLGYFGVLCSSLGRGQTAGMKLLGLRVVGIDGSSLGLMRSCGRALLLEAPFLINGIRLNGSGSIVDRMATVTADTLLYGVAFAQIFLLFVNRPSRRLLHDLVFGSAVVRVDQVPIMPEPSTVSQAAFAIVAVTLVLAIVVTARDLRQSAPLMAVQAAVQGLPEVEQATAAELTTTYIGGEPPPGGGHEIALAAQLRSWPSDAAAEVTRLGKRLVAAYAVEPGQKVRISLSYGYSIGIVSGARAYSAFFTPGEHARFIHPLLRQHVAVNPAFVKLPKSEFVSTCPVPIPTLIRFTWPRRISMTTQSMWTFERYNDNGYGTMMVIAHLDGTVRALIAPTRDIDTNLRASLNDYAKRIAFVPTAKCGAGFASFLVHFAVPSGIMSAVPIHPTTHLHPQPRT
jgi:uncharacterized RDD family membrane protein YckC